MPETQENIMINMNALIIELIAMFVLAGPQLKFNCITGWLVAVVIITATTLVDQGK